MTNALQSEPWKIGRREDREFIFNYFPFNCSKPVIAMINGYCLGGSLEFITMFDVRYCSDDARVAVTETRLAFDVLTLAMPWVIVKRYRELIYTGDTFDATEAYRLGLVSRVCPKDRLDEEVMRSRCKNLPVVAGDEGAPVS